MYTKGPWELVTDLDEDFDANFGPYSYQKVGVKISDNIHWVGFFTECNSMAKEKMANACLIAASPELLNACELLLNTVVLCPYGLSKQQVNSIQKVIEKAKGVGVIV